MRLRNEIQALHLVIPLLAEDRDLGRAWFGSPSILTVSRDWNWWFPSRF